MKVKHIVLASSLIFLTACSSSVDPATGQRDDPLEGFNRAMWKVNYDFLDPYVLKPVATGWKEYVPSPVKTGLVNVANNLDEPVSFVNRLFEGEGQKAMVHFNRFWINSIFGLGGLIDWASQTKDLKLETEQREFGDTMGTYKVPTGSYVMLPGMGASTPRQLVGKGVDAAYSILTYTATPWSVAKFVVQGVDSRAKRIGQEALLEQSSDPYTTFREAYFQHLEFKVNDGKATEASDGQETLSEEELQNID